MMKVWLLRNGRAVAPDVRTSAPVTSNQDLQSSIAAVPAAVWRTASEAEFLLSRVNQVCALKPASKAFFKLLELNTGVSELGGLVIPRQKITAAFLCEAPGGFVEAAGFLFQRRSLAASAALNRPGSSYRFWTLSKLAPPEVTWAAELAPSDSSFAGELVHGVTTGDIFDPTTKKQFIHQVLSECSGGVQLVTADGGYELDASSRGSQELVMLPLLIAEITLGLQLLTTGGTFVLKLFGLYESKSRLLVTYLSSFFNDVLLMKPDASKPCNCELYFVGKGFRAAQFALLQPERLWATACQFSGSMIAFSLDAALVDFQRALSAAQRSALLYALQVANKTRYPPSARRQIERAASYCRSFGLRLLSK